MSKTASDNDALLTVKEVAEYLNIKVATLYDWRYKKIGPPALRAGWQLRYRRSDVDAWMERESGR